MAEYSLGTAHGTVKIDSDTSGVDQANKALGGLDTNAQKSGMSIDQVGTRMGIAGAVIAGGFGVAVNTAASFEAQLSGIAAVSGASAGEMDKISEAALRIGKDTSFSASEAAGAMTELAKAGVPVKDILGGVADATVALAAATGVDLSTAATIASDTMNMFGLKASDMGGIVDTLAQTANASSIDVTDLGMAMSQVGAVANLAGMSFEDTASAIGQMGNAGIKGSDAGTSLKTMLSNLQPSTEAQSKAMQELGLITEDGTNKFYDAQGNLKSLRDIQDILNGSTKNLTAQQKQMALETIFGSDAIRAAAVLADGGAASYDAFAESQKATGSAAEQAKIRQDNFKGSLEQLKGSLETAGIQIGTILIPAIRSLVDWLGSLLGWFLELDSSTQKWILGFIGGAGALLLMGAAIIKTVSFFKSLHAALVTLRILSDASNASFIKTAATSVASAARSAAAWVLSAAQTTAAWVATAARTVAAWVLMGVQSGIQALKVAAAWLVTNGAAAASAVASTVANVARMLAQWVLLGVQSGLQALRVAAAWVVVNGPALAAAVAQTAVAVGSMVAGWVLLGIQSLIQAAKVALAWVIALGPIGWAIAALIAVVAFVVIFWDDIVAFFKAGAEKVAEWMKAAWQWIQEAWDAIVNAFKAAGQFIWDVLKSIGQFILDAVTAYLQFWWNLANGIWDAMKAAWNWIVSVWNGIIDFIRGIPGWIGSVFSSAGSWLVSAGQNILSGLANGIWAGVQWVWNGITSIANSIINFFAGAWNWLVDAGRNLLIGLWNGISAMGSWLWNKVTGWAKGLVNGVLGFFGIKSPSRVFAEIGEYLMMGLGKGIDNEAAGAVESATSVAQQVVGAMQDGLAAGASLSATVGASLTDGTLAALGSGVSLGTNIGTAVSGLNGGNFSKNSSQAAIDKEFGRMVSIEMNTYNPVAEKASDSEARKLRAAAAVGAF